VCRVKSEADARERFVAPRRWQKEQLQRVAERVVSGLGVMWRV
jgi:hypothetical protein